MDNLIIICGTNSEISLNRKAQEYAKKLGYDWSGPSDYIDCFFLDRKEDRVILFCKGSKAFNPGVMTYGSYMEYFDKVGNITDYDYSDYKVIDFKAMNVNKFMNIE